MFGVYSFTNTPRSLTAKISRAFARWHDPRCLQVTVGEHFNPLNLSIQQAPNNACLNYATHGVFYYQCLDCHSTCQES
jgi:hypothetical protein